MKKLFIGLLAVSSVSSYADTTICTALCHKTSSSFGYTETSNNFVSVIAKGVDEKSATAELLSKCKKYDKESKPVLGISTSNTKDSDYVRITIVEANSFSCINL